MAENRRTEPGQESRDRRDASWLAQYYTRSKTAGESSASLPEDGPAPVDVLKPGTGADYEITGQVGLGGMKVVHRAHDSRTDRDVALAMLQKHAQRSAQERRFLREARITAALEHPNIVPVHEIGLDAEDRPYFTMKLVGGESLHDILKQLDAGDPGYGRQYPLGRLLEIFRGVCQAIAFAHSRGVVHLDLKPANIQVGSFGEVLVLDWGLAKVLEPPADTGPQTVVQLPDLLREPPVEGVVRGTPGYMAPEQERGDFQGLDARTDVFALGSVLRAILKSQRTLRQAPAALEAVAAKAMAANPENRYPTADLLSQDVRAFVGGYAVSAQTVGLGTIFWLLVKRHKAVSTVALVSALTIATLLTVFVVRIKQGERRALDMLARLSAEQAEKARLGRYAAPRLMSLAQELIRNSDYDEALANLGLCAVFDTNMMSASQMKGFLHLGRQEFDEAVTTFDRVPGFERRAKRDVSLRAGELAEKYQRLASPTGSLSDAQLLQLIADLSNRTNGFRIEHREVTLGQMFFRLNQTRGSDPVHLQFVGVAISRLNPSATNVAFSFRTEEVGTTIELHGDRVTQILPLAGLRLHALDLSGTEVEDLRWIRNSGLRVLDLSGRSPKAGSRVGDLAPLFALPITELRLVNCPRIRFDQLRSLPKLEKVVVSKAQSNTVQRILSQSRITADVAGE